MNVAALVGMSLGHFHLVEKPGEGGMAAFFNRYGIRLERHVTVSVNKNSIAIGSVPVL
jgi:hypothetical protein